MNSYDQQRQTIEELHMQQRENSETILILARELGKALSERDRARDLAAALETILAREGIDPVLGARYPNTDDDA